MSTMFSRPEARAVSSVPKKTPSVRSVRIRMSGEEDAYDTDTDSFTKRTMRRGKRTTSEGQGSSSALRSRKPLRKRQVVAPAPAPAPAPEEEEESEDDDEDDEDEDDEESSDSSDSSDSDIEGVEGAESDSSLDSISSGSEDESEEEEQEEETPRAGERFTQTNTAHFHTLVPGAGGSEPSQVSGEAPTEAQPSSAVQASATAAPSSAQPTTVPTDTVVNEGPIPDSESTTGIPQATSTIINSDGAAATGDAAGQVDGGSSGPSRGAEVGIVIGTLAIAAILIAGAVFWYRRRRQRSNNDHIERLPDEKTLPPDPPTFRLSAPPPIRGQRTQSSIMDEAMGAAYQQEFNGYENNNLSRDFYAPNYEKNEKAGAVAMTAPVSPASPGANLSPQWAPASPRTQQQQQAMSNFQLFPAPTPPPMVPQPVAQVSNVSGPLLTNNPPQQNGFRFEPPPGPRSVAATETTDAGTWSTFANERLKANGGKLPLKERVLGHF